MRNITLEIPFEITSASRPRVTRYGTFYSKNYEAFRKVVGEWLEKQEINKLEGAIKAKIIFLMPMPKSWSKKKKEELDNKYCLANKDVDNFCKSIFDILQGKAYDNDSQIASIEAKKLWTNEKGHITVELEEAEEDDQQP